MNSNEIISDEEFGKLETRIYGFSVDVFSFVKTLIDNNLSNQETRLLLNTANELYTVFLDVIDKKGEVDPIILRRCMQLSESCSNYLSNIEVDKKMLNEKVDLNIEANELGRILNKICSKIELN